MILDDIVADKLPEIENRKRKTPLVEIKKLAEKQHAALDFAAVLKGGRINIIAEVKKASPSKGIIRADFNPVEIAMTYARNGAAAISVLTDEKYFMGSLEYLKAIRKALDMPVPLLRKDFILDEYQVYEARAAGADAVLLITAILDREKLGRLLNLSRSLGMRCLVEVHDESELEIALDAGAGIIGINNRDLRTFKTDLEVTGRLSRLVPNDKIIVSESGIKDRCDMEKLKGWNIDAVLIGESLMKSIDIASAMKEFL